MRQQLAGGAISCCGGADISLSLCALLFVCAAIAADVAKVG